MGDDQGQQVGASPTDHRPRPKDDGERFGPWVFLVVSLVAFVVGGVMPVTQYVSHHHPGVPFERARVHPCTHAYVPNSTVCASTSGGAQIAVAWEGHVLNPRTGTQITVFEKNGRWYARDGRALPLWSPVFLVLGGLGAVACALTLLRRLRRSISRR